MVIVSPSGPRRTNRVCSILASRHAPRPGGADEERLPGDRHRHPRRAQPRDAGAVRRAGAARAVGRAGGRTSRRSPTAVITSASRRIPYRRKMRAERPCSTTVRRVPGRQSPLKGAVTAVLDTPPSAGINNLNATGRLHDMDVEGVDVHLIIPATFATAVSALDVEMANEIHAAYLRYIGEYCCADPQRLKATVPVLAADPERAAESCARRRRSSGWRRSPRCSPRACRSTTRCSTRVWAAMNDADLPIMHHSFFYEPPYFPGYRDMWGNVVVARAAAHPWGAQRLLGYLMLQRAVRPVPQPADRVRRVQRRLVAGVAGAPAWSGGLHEAGAAARRARPARATPARATSTAASSCTRARRSPARSTRCSATA